MCSTTQQRTGRFSYGFSVTNRRSCTSGVAMNMETRETACLIELLVVSGEAEKDSLSNFLVPYCTGCFGKYSATRGTYLRFSSSIILRNSSLGTSAHRAIFRP